MAMETAGTGGDGSPSFEVPLSNVDRWRHWPGKIIPTKGDCAHTVSLLFEKLKEEGDNRGRCLDVLDLGCGDGSFLFNLFRELERKGLKAGRVAGVDICEEGVRVAKDRVAQQGEKESVFAPQFFVADLCDARRMQSLKIEAGLDFFDVVLLQLVLSVVGSESERRTALEHSLSFLRDGGIFYLSVSGASGDINPEYQLQYEKDEPLTKEKNTYFSRDSSTGAVLYSTHHFEVEELRSLLESVGLEEVVVRQVKETSSRRPDQAAFFLYACGRKAHTKQPN
uniref:Methyltransferase domain-containing protein n=1 Tax=Chromera velia CCMP2878 TaxID=1169474 RepID=A0A0G4GVW1_9ALVE|eukprot:Cvel_5287.t1-p1 / transcript=Cvel_5287.t1 / gene=Cvel_5287 / organism=Chromera_velia_CCMP2878 / gene_product=hypothetical protein / transcript_product=hypothetical protein / location=Cvel_scaffold244:65677-67468(-) / protein_length=280 / sequence_SO=supercontig / SO=protein_coding / is_pseudo=false